MTAICQQAGLTERYFYESFKGRDDLLVALVDEIAEQVRAAVLAALRDTAGDAAAKARRAISVFAELLTDDPRKGRAAIIESTTVPILRQRRHELFGDFAALVVTQARVLFGDNALPTPQDEISALLLVGGLGELLTAWLQGETNADVEDIVNTATRWFTVGMHAQGHANIQTTTGSREDRRNHIR